MASDPYVTEARGVFQGTVGSTALTAGTPVYFDGTDWEKADATDNTKYAEAIAAATFATGVQGYFCRSGIIVDIDAPYTQGDQYFLSATAGAITATRPTGANNLVQVLGFGLSTSELAVDIPPVKELSVNLVPYVHDSAATYDKDGDFTGWVLADTSNGNVGYQCMIPQSVVGVEIAYLWWTGTGTALDTSDTYTIDFSAGIDDETTTATTDGIAAAALTVAANDLNRADVSAAFDGTGIIEAGNLLGGIVAKAAEGTGGDDPIMGSINLVLLTV